MEGRFPLAPLPVREKVAPRSVQQLAQLLVDWSTIPGYQFDETYPDVKRVMGRAMASDEVRKIASLKRINSSRQVEIDYASVFIRLVQTEMIAAMAEDRQPAAHVTLPPDDIYQSETDYIRSLAIMSVDGDRGYTMEFASSPEEHRETWDRVEQNIRAAIKAGLAGQVVEFEDHPND